MTDLPVLRDLGLILVAAALCVLLARRLRAPTIVAYILAGLVLGPGTGLLGAAEPIELIAEVGIVLLLFLVGLELSLDKIRDVGKTALIAGVGQIGLTTAGGFGIGKAGCLFGPRGVDPGLYSLLEGDAVHGLQSGPGRAARDECAGG